MICLSYVRCYEHTETQPTRPTPNTCHSLPTCTAQLLSTTEEGKEGMIQGAALAGCCPWPPL